MEVPGVRPVGKESAGAADDEQMHSRAGEAPREVQERLCVEIPLLLAPHAEAVDHGVKRGKILARQIQYRLFPHGDALRHRPAVFVDARHKRGDIMPAAERLLGDAPPGASGGGYNRKFHVFGTSSI